MLVFKSVLNDKMVTDVYFKYVRKYSPWRYIIYLLLLLEDDKKINYSVNEDQSNLFSRRENVQHVLQQCWMLNLHRVTTADPVDFLQNVKIFLSLWSHQPDLSTKMEEACSTILSLSINGKKIMTFASLTNHCKERLADILSSIIQYSYQAYQNDKKFGFPFTASPTSFVPLFECLELSQREKIARKALDELPTIDPDQCDLVEDCHQDLLLRFAQVLSSTVNALTIAGIVILDSIFTHYFQSIIFRWIILRFELGIFV